MTYRPGRSWRVTIVREGEAYPAEVLDDCAFCCTGGTSCPLHPPAEDQLHAVVMAGKILTTDAELAELVCDRLNAVTPDVTYARGAAEALALVADRIADAAEGFTPHALGTLGDILEGVAANLGVDEDAPPGPLSASVTAQQPPAAGQDRPDAHSGSQAITGRLRAILDRWDGKTGESYDIREFSRGLHALLPREPERKADQAYTCPDHPGPLDDPTGHICRLRPARGERTTP